MTTATDYFSMPIDFERRFASFLPVLPRPARPAGRLVVPGTLAYWRFDGGGAAGTPVTASQTKYGGKIDRIFHGSVGDVRIVNRALPVTEFMIGK